MPNLDLVFDVVRRGLQRGFERGAAGRAAQATAGSLQPNFHLESLRGVAVVGQNDLGFADPH